METSCDEYCANYGCNQGRDCPARKCPNCQDASGLKCTCHSDRFKTALAWILSVFTAVILVVLTIRSCA